MRKPKHIVMDTVTATPDACACNPVIKKEKINNKIIVQRNDPNRKRYGYTFFELYKQRQFAPAYFQMINKGNKEMIFLKERLHYLFIPVGKK